MAPETPKQHFIRSDCVAKMGNITVYCVFTSITWKTIDRHMRHSFTRIPLLTSLSGCKFMRRSTNVLHMYFIILSQIASKSENETEREYVFLRSKLQFSMLDRFDEVDSGICIVNLVLNQNRGTFLIYVYWHWYDVQEDLLSIRQTSTWKPKIFPPSSSAEHRCAPIFNSISIDSLI